MNVLAIGAHPDDIELGAGATIHKHVENGDTVKFLVLTRGERGTKESGARKKEAERAVRKLGVEDIEVKSFPDTGLRYNYEVIEAIEEVVDAFDPDIVYTHSKSDTHQDHIRANKASITACRDVKQIYSYESPSTRPSFKPERFVEISDEDLEAKKDALKAFDTQKDKRFMEMEAMEGLAKYRGRQAGSKHAEAFQVMKEVVGNV